MKVKTTNQFHCLDEINICNLLAKVFTAAVADTDIVMGEWGGRLKGASTNFEKSP